MNDEERSEEGGGESADAPSEGGMGDTPQPAPLPSDEERETPAEGGEAEEGQGEADAGAEEAGGDEGEDS